MVHPFVRPAQLLILATSFAVHLAASAQVDTTVPAFDKLDSMEARVQGCVTCHGRQGQGTNNDYFPRIASKPAGYLYNQLLAFKQGRRRYAPMNYLVSGLSDDYLREMAEYFALLKPPFAPAQPPAMPADVRDRGRMLVTAGDASRQVPACVACHGANLTGTAPGIPGLAGLRYNYIAAQLTRWRNGERTAAAPDCMQRIASRLGERDISAVSAWLSALPAPADPSPQARAAVGRMPFACGSQP